MYKDKNDFEYEDFHDIECTNEEDVICPCCGDVKDVEEVRLVIDKSIVELKCLKCGCIFEATSETRFSTVCKKYRTDEKGK